MGALFDGDRRAPLLGSQNARDERIRVRWFHGPLIMMFLEGLCGVLWSGGKRLGKDVDVTDGKRRLSAGGYLRHSAYDESESRTLPTMTVNTGTERKMNE